MSNIFSSALSILEFVLAFGVLVFLHELGHFITARISHIDVEEFGFGFPPRIVKLFTWKGTLFSLNWVPFGGFCRMKGENLTDTQPGSFAAASPWKRLLTLLGGPLMNLLLGMFLIVFIFMKMGSYDTSRVEILDVATNSPAAIAQILPGDIIEKVNDDAVTSMDGLSVLVKDNLGKTTDLTLLRGEETIVVQLVPRVNPPEGEGAMGVSITNPTVPVTFLQAVPAAALSTLEQGAQLIMIPVKLISGQLSSEDTRLVSVVGLYDIYNEVKTEDSQSAATNPQMANLLTISYLATLSIALGYTNLLPFPAIDGGRILFLIPELLFKKKVRPELENRVHLIGFSLLMILMVVLVINDIINPIKIP
jgi:regulator of sigma E protease